MKNTLLISLLLLATFTSFGQSYTYIPDTAFEQALINQGYDNVLDGRILTSAAASVTRLEMPNQNPKITDITGIEAFINLEYFDAIDNSIVVLDFTKNVKLQEIRCWHNTPTERTVEMLDVTGLTDLTYVGLDNNLIRVGDFSTNSALEIVGIQNNELTSLKFHPNANLTFLRLADNDLITHVDISNNDTNLNTFRAVNNPNLSCIQVSDLNNAQTNPGWDEDAISVYSTTACTEADYTVIPDPGFEQFLIDSNWDSGSPDGRVLSANLNFTGRNNTITINEATYNINELTGIQDFTDELEAVDIQNQPLNIPPYLGPKTNINSLVFKQNPSLNQVSFLPYSNLTTLALENNGITSLAVTEFPLLTSLQVWENLNYLDVSFNTNLASLSLNNNNLNEIDLVPLINLENVSLYGNNLTAIDVTQNVNLTQLTLGENNLSEINISNNLGLTSLDLGYNNIASLNVRPHGLIELLDLEFNNFTSIDVTQNPNLTHLLLTNNQLSSIDISQNTNLQVLELDENELTEVDLSAQTNLFLFYINDNQITELDITNSFVSPGPGIFRYFNAQNNPALSCIQVDDATEAQAEVNWTKDAAASYSENCGEQLFTVTTSIGGDVIDTDNEACCTAYEIKEGQLLEIYFESDATATDGEEYIVQLSISGSEATSADISNREPSANLQYTYTVKPGNPDNTMQIDIVDDGIPEALGENLKLTFTPVGSNFTFSGTTVYDIKLKDKTPSPFVVDANLTGNITGNAPNYTVIEGQTFNLNFNADTSAPNGTNYIPSISITQAGEPDASGDFTITGLNQPIMVSTGNPDGGIQFTPKDDGNNNGDEVYTITIASENTNLYTITEPVSFTVTVKDQGANIPFEIKTGVQLSINGYDINETKFLTPPFRVKEGQNFRVYHSIEVTFDAEGILNSDLAEYTVDIKTKEGTANSKDFTGIIQNDFVIKNNENDIDSTLYGISLEIDTIIEQDEDFFIEITPKQPNIRFRDLEGNLLNAGETLTIPITIIESYIYGDRVRFEASLEGDVTESAGEYYVDEGGKIEVVFNSLETIADDFEFNVPFSVYGEKEDIDYIVESENPLIKIDNSKPHDGKLVVSVLNDNENEVDETIGITLNQSMDNNYHADFINGAPEISFTINVNNKATNQVAAVLSNTGGMESASNNIEDQRFDIITLSLLDFEGNPYNAEQTIEFKAAFTTEGLLDPAEDEDYIPEAQKFIIEAGSSIATIKIVYPKEQDPADKEADYYNVSLVQDNNIPQNISLPDPLGVKILDNEEPFRFKIKFVGNADLIDNGSPDCCTYRKVEENSILKFEITAEKGVPVGMEYMVSIEDSNNVGTSDAEEDAVKDIDYKLISFNGDKEAKFTSNGNENEADGTWICGILDNLEGTSKQFNLSFKAWIIHPNTEEKVELPGGGSYDFTIIKANPVNVTLDGNNIINEDDEENNATQIRIYYQGDPGGDYNVDFELSGSVLVDDFDLSASTKINYNFTKGTGNIELKRNLEGVYEAFITVTALNEPEGQEVNEDDETLTITLVDGFGYKVGNSDFQTITITDEDRADHYAAIRNVSQNTNIYENPAANQSNRAVLEVFLQDEAGNTLDAEEDISIQFTPNAGNNGQPKLDEDYKIYLGKDENLKDINTDTMVITILNGESSGYLTIEAIDDDTEENENETITIALTTGKGYNIGAQKETAVTIISDERGDEFDPSQISATVSNPTCPGFDEGAIVIENNSQFDFVAELHPIDPNIPAQELLQDSKISFKDLKLGDYEIRLKAPENLDGIPPSFKLSIRNELQPTALLATSKQPSAKTARLTVSGAKRYKAWVNGQAHHFEFDDRQIHQLQIPLENGQNQIFIDGETPCQGQLKTTLYLANYQVYPNPTENTVTLSGLVAQTKTQVNLFSAEGQLALSFEGVSSNSGFLEVDVSILPPGMYFGKVRNEQQELFQIKLLKN